MNRRALVLLFSCGLLFASYPGKTIHSHQASTTDGTCKRCFHYKKDHYSGTGMCMQFDGCAGFIK